MPVIFLSFISRKILISAIFLLFLLSFQQVFAADSVCELDSANREWIKKTVDAWEKVREHSLYISSHKLPRLILFDESCVWNINANSAEFSAKNAAKGKIVLNKKSYAFFASKHEGKIALPENGEIPAQLLTFAATYENGEKAFLVSAMPSIWRKAPHLQDEKNVETLIKSVFVHEMTHTFHHKYHAKLNVIEKTLQDAENFDDDIIQDIFGKNEEFKKAYEKEHELLFQAVGEKDLTKKRKLAKAVYEKIQARRKQFFTNENAVYEELEEIFLTMEGAGNWAAYKSAMNQGMNETDALKLIRRSEKYWSQDEGIGLFLLIDALFPKWQKKAFGNSQMSVTDLLGEALK